MGQTDLLNFMMKKIVWAVTGLMLMAAAGCNKEKIVDNTGLYKGSGSTSSSLLTINTDKATYNPGDAVKFTVTETLPSGARVRYKSSGTILQDASLTGQSWSWTTPNADYIGYMVEIYTTSNSVDKIYGTIAVDVSSDPAHFPRNGFLSAYGALTSVQMTSVMSSLNRYHMNYVQFQDWEYEDQVPLAGTVASPAPSWTDIASRTNYLNTVQGYITLAHNYNMKALSYNLCYGALNNAASEGVMNQWYLYNDAGHTTKNEDVLGAPFKSSISVLNPANTSWQSFIANNTSQAFQVYNFDGWQIDQLGDRGTVYDYNGNQVDLTTTFNPFITAMKNSMPAKRMVMNAVNQYGQTGIASAPVDFLYTEVWTPNDGFSDLATIIQNNNSLTNNAQQTVLAAYMDYNLAGSKGYFNTPGVIMTDAVIFAFGGSHIELGEHMLGQEYFPNANLTMPDDLKAAMVSYYDFLTGYENLLRGGGTFNSPVLSSADNQLKLNNWPPQTGQVSVVGKDFGTEQVIHLINFTNANSLEWRDTNGTEIKPVTVNNPSFVFNTSKTVKSIWMASPDLNGGASQNIAFTQSGSQVSFILPSLQYWDMIVVQYQ